MTWRTRSDGSIDLAVITGFQLATADGAIAVRLDLCRSQDQLAGRAAGDVEQVVMTPPNTMKSSERYHSRRVQTPHASVAARLRLDAKVTLTGIETPIFDNDPESGIEEAKAA